MEYEVVKTKDKGYRKYGVHYSTILYELENSPDISELYLHQEKLINNLINNIGENKLYAIVSCFYGKANAENSNEYKLWKGLMPVDGEEFSLIEHADFQKPLFEQKLEGRECILWNGIAEINPCFYSNNYKFFNYQKMRFLLIATNAQVDEIKKNINNYLAVLVDKKFPFNEYKKHLLHLLQEIDCILVETQDDAHSSSFLCYVNQNSKHRCLLEMIF